MTTSANGEIERGREAPGLAAHVRRVVWELRTEGAGPVREAAAIGLGVFIGCSPLYGLHLLICWAVGWCLGLNRLKMYLAANISNPLMAPLLVLTELQTGAWLRRRELHALTLETVRTTDPWTFGADLVIGSLVVGAAIGTMSGAATYLVARSNGVEPWFADLLRRASDRYLSTGITAWEFAKGKLRGDPVYRAALAAGVLPSGGTLVDVGCGQGLMLALLAESREAWRAGRWPQERTAPPLFDALVGIETRARVAKMARRALDGAATIVEGDAREHVPSGARAILFFDVLHMMPGADQERLLSAVARSLEPGGVVLVRESDAAAGWRFLAVRAGNRLKAVVTGNWRQTFHFRTAAEWTACFERLGFRVRQQGADQGTPFANELFVLSGRDRASA
ncbi:MAG TPA: DUF2062 domain-containing protein [Vicinamibacterales bacterium]|nr:DUF2062 domain-containing protein [Vicinamibacterales bacterium]